MVVDVFLETQNDSKNYVSVQDDEITELSCAYYKIGMRLTLTLTLTSAVRDI